MNKFHVGWLLPLVAISFLMTGCYLYNFYDSGSTYPSDCPMATSESNTGDIAEDFTLTDVNGQVHKLSDYKGKKVYIKFWASWCSVCLQTLEDTNEIAADPDKDFVILSIVAPGFGDEMPKDKFISWFKKKGYESLPVLLDEGGEVTRAYGIHVYPSGALIDTEGKVHAIVPGHMTKDMLKREMAKLP